MTVIDVLGIVIAVALIAGSLGWLLRGRSDDSWIEATRHDISILPGGQVLHHTTCPCKAMRPQPIRPDPGMPYEGWSKRRRPPPPVGHPTIPPMPRTSGR